MFGGQLGYNWQTGSWVWGVEGDFDGSNINKLNNVGETIFAGGPRSPGDHCVVLRGRQLAGPPPFAAVLAMPGAPEPTDVTGGGAWASVDFNAGGPANDFVFSSTSTKSGWTIGAGYELAD